jgi:hypothetical protein
VHSHGGSIMVWMATFERMGQNKVGLAIHNKPRKACAISAIWKAARDRESPARRLSCRQAAVDCPVESSGFFDSHEPALKHGAPTAGDGASGHATSFGGSSFSAGEYSPTVPEEKSPVLTMLSLPSGAGNNARDCAHKSAAIGSGWKPWLCHHVRSDPERWSSS